jgi:hypothetical protein
MFITLPNVLNAWKGLFGANLTKKIPLIADTGLNKIRLGCKFAVK